MNDNGIASLKTARGEIRWKALHHERLNAVDPGDCSDCNGDTFNDRFRRRELDDFPCLKNLAYVATSDAYALDKIGRRFTWLRMGEPTIEAMRQAFLDHEARIICDWDPRLAGYPNGDPNEVRHGWIESVKIAGELGNSREPLSIPLHPGLNTIIGGRGSGKSTIVAALRKLYAGAANLPEKIRAEVEGFSDVVFPRAQLEAVHRLPNSQERQTATWSELAGAMTRHAGAQDVPTSFKVRVVNQKELFERVSRNKEDAFAASRSFLAFVDESLGFGRVANAAAGSWWRLFEAAGVAWMAAMRTYQTLVADLGQLPAARAKVTELEGQIAAFDSPEVKARLQRIRFRQAERDELAEQVTELLRWLDELTDDIAGADDVQAGDVPADDGGLAKLKTSLAKVKLRVNARLADLKREGRAALAEFAREREATDWWRTVQDAEVDAAAYASELQAKGIDPKTFTQLQQQLRAGQSLLKELTGKESERDTAKQAVEKAWAAIAQLLDARLGERQNLLAEVGSRSGTLKFSVIPRGDFVGWAEAVRTLLNLRSDSFLEEVPALGQWLWGGKPSEAEARWDLWRQALATGFIEPLSKASQMRGNLAKKLQSLDETVRLRLATEVADDVVVMKFLRDGGTATKEEDWQAITEGSPGQRTAAMLGFVLHHGVEPLVLDQPEDDLDTEWISNLVVKELRASRWKRQIIVITHNANIPVNGDADQVIVLENVDQTLRVRSSEVDGKTVHHCGPIEFRPVRNDIQNIMEGGITAFIRREKKYNNEMRLTRIENGH